VKLTKAYVSVYNGVLQLNVGKWGTIEKTSEPVETADVTQKPVSVADIVSKSESTSFTCPHCGKKIVVGKG